MSKNSATNLKKKKPRRVQIGSDEAASVADKQKKLGIKTLAELAALTGGLSAIILYFL